MRYQLLRKDREAGITDVVGVYSSDLAVRVAWHMATEEETCSMIYYTVRELL